MHHLDFEGNYSAVASFTKMVANTFKCAVYINTHKRLLPSTNPLQ